MKWKSRRREVPEWLEYDQSNDSWKFAIGKELRAAGYDVDLNSI